MISIDNYPHLQSTYLSYTLFGGDNMVTLGIAQSPVLGRQEGNLLQLECVHFILFLILRIDQFGDKSSHLPKRRVFVRISSKCWITGANFSFTC